MLDDGRGRGRLGRNAPKLKGVPTVELVAVASEGFRALQDDGSNIGAILDRLAAVEAGVTVPKVSSFYGKLHVWLLNSPDPSVDAIRNIVARHAAAAFPRSNLGSLYGRCDLPWERITLGAAARLWGVTPGKALKATRLAGVAISRKTRMHEITRAQYHLVQDWLTNHMTVDDARLHSGVTIKVFYTLLKAGLLPPRKALPSDPFSFFNQQELEDLVSRAHGGCPVIDRCPPGCVTIEGASRPFHGTAALIRALLERRIKAIGRLASRTGLAAIIVRLAESDDVATNAAGGMISGVQAASMLGMGTTQTITKAIAHGLLSATYPGAQTKKAGRLLKRAEVLRFDSDFVMPSRLRKDFRISSPKVTSLLQAAGVIPVIRGRKGTLYVRMEAERALREFCGSLDGGPFSPAPPLVAREAEPIISRRNPSAAPSRRNSRPRRSDA